MTNRKPYQQAYYPPMPTRATCFWRTNVLYQAWRFLMINLKMVRVISKSHH